MAEDNSVPVCYGFCFITPHLIAVKLLHNYIDCLCVVTQYYSSEKQFQLALLSIVNIFDDKINTTLKSVPLTVYKDGRH